MNGSSNNNNENDKKESKATTRRTAKKGRIAHPKERKGTEKLENERV
jgi:hypothetical protein